MRRHHGWVTAIGLVLVTAGEICCISANTEIEPVVFGLRDRLRPDGADVVGFSGLRRDRSGVHASWEILTGMEWSAYSSWAAARVPPDFTRGSGESPPLVFRKVLPGDSLVLSIEPVAGSQPMRVRVTFDGYPN